MLVTGQPERPEPERKVQAIGRMTMMVLTVAVLMVALSGVAFATSEPLSRFVGTGGNDSIRGTAGDDVIHGGKGDDRTEERAVHGGPGNDIVLSIYAAAGDYVDCGDGADTVQKAGAPNLNLDRFVNCEKFVK